MKNKVLDAFCSQYGDTDGISSYFAPGRVNLIGEHTDYNGGYVFPCALSLGTYAAVKKRPDRKLRFFSLNFPETGVIKCSLDELKPYSGKDWSMYIQGVIWAFCRRGLVPDCGMDIVVGGDLPNGAGLSSSASLEIVTGLFLNDLYQFKVPVKTLALLGQTAENQYAGVNCGIMDQFACAAGKAGTALLLNTLTLDFERVPLALNGQKLIITNTNKKHSLHTSAYNERRQQCACALQEIQKSLSINTLCELDPGVFESVQHLITDPVTRRRVRHVVTENQRVLDAVKMLRNNHLEEFGMLMNESHRSLRDDYEVSCPELDVLAQTAWDTPGVLGSRMTGGGFGGCTVSLVEEKAAEAFCEKTGRIYRERIGYDCTFYIMN